VQREVDSSCDARGRENAVTAVDPEDVWVDFHGWMLSGEAVGVAPVRRRASAVQQPRVGQGEGSGADRDDTSATPVSASERVQSVFVDRRAAGLEAGNDDRVGARECAESLRCDEIEAGRRRDRPGLARADA